MAGAGAMGSDGRALTTVRAPSCSLSTETSWVMRLYLSGFSSKTAQFIAGAKGGVWRGEVRTFRLCSHPELGVLSRLGGSAGWDARVKRCAVEAGLGAWGPSPPRRTGQRVGRNLISGNGDKWRNLAQCEGSGTRRRTGIAGTAAGLATGT